MARMKKKKLTAKQRSDRREDVIGVGGIAASGAILGASVAGPVGAAVGAVAAPAGFFGFAGAIRGTRRFIDAPMKKKPRSKK